MSVTPEGAPEPLAEEVPVHRRRPNRLLGVCFAIFTFEVGIFLVVFPWTDNWNLNYFLLSIVLALRFKAGLVSAQYTPFAHKRGQQLNQESLILTID